MVQPGPGGSVTGGGHTGPLGRRGFSTSGAPTAAPGHGPDRAFDRPDRRAVASDRSARVPSAVARLPPAPDQDRGEQDQRAQG